MYSLGPILTSSTGQHDHTPEGCRQQVLPSGHWYSASHCTLLTGGSRSRFGSGLESSFSIDQCRQMAKKKSFCQDMKKTRGSTELDQKALDISAGKLGHWAWTQITDPIRSPHVIILFIRVEESAIYTNLILQKLNSTTSNQYMADLHFSMGSLDNQISSQWTLSSKTRLTVR